jgi:chromosome segregation and condensation protein ScpB
MPAHRETAGTRRLVSASDCAAVAERRLGQPLPEPLSQAAIDALAISPTSSRSPAPTADTRGIRGVDSDPVLETLMARRLVA